MIPESDQLLQLSAINRARIVRETSPMCFVLFKLLISIFTVSYRSLPGSRIGFCRRLRYFCLLMATENSAIERTWAMTFVSALLAQSFSDEEVPRIHHCCGLHNSSTNEMNGPNGLHPSASCGSSSISMPFVSASRTTMNEYHEFQRFDTMRLCALFSDLVMDLSITRLRPHLHH